jgi:hypothetical protein
MHAGIISALGSHQRFGLIEADVGEETRAVTVRVRMPS